MRHAAFRRGQAIASDSRERDRHAEHLAHGGLADHQVPRNGIGLAEELGEDARRRIAEEEAAGQRPGAQAQFVDPPQQEHDEQQDEAFESGFVELARMARLPARHGERPSPRARRSGRRPTSSPLMKLAMRPKNRPDRHRAAIRSPTPKKLSLLRQREQRRSRDHAEQPAMERHAAMPERQDLERMVQIVARLVEQHIAEPAAQHDAEGRPDQEIVDLFRVSGRGLRAARKRGSASRRSDRRYRRARTSGWRSRPIRMATGIEVGKRQRHGQR